MDEGMLTGILVGLIIWLSIEAYQKAIASLEAMRYKREARLWKRGYYELYVMSGEERVKLARSIAETKGADWSVTIKEMEADLEEAKVKLAEIPV